jgi:hypothetical protein
MIRCGRGGRTAQRTGLVAVAAALFAWALDPWREANLLAFELHPPELSIAEAGSGRIELQRSTRRGLAQALVTSDDLTQWTTNAAASPDEAWDVVTEAITPTARQFWRLRTGWE